MRRYAWYSTKMFIIGGYVKYHDLHGNEVIGTCISNSPTDSGTKWDDIICLGEIDTHAKMESHIDNIATARSIELLMEVGPEKWDEWINNMAMAN